MEHRHPPDPDDERTASSDWKAEYRHQDVRPEIPEHGVDADHAGGDRELRADGAGRQVALEDAVEPGTTDAPETPNDTDDEDVYGLPECPACGAELGDSLLTAHLNNECPLRAGGDA